MTEFLQGPLAKYVLLAYLIRRIKKRRMRDSGRKGARGFTYFLSFFGLKLSAKLDDITEEEEEEEDVVVVDAYPSFLPHAPSLAPALRDWLIGLFHDDTCRTRGSNQQYFRAFGPFWKHFEEAISPSLSPSLPLSNPQALRRWLLEIPHVQARILTLRK